MPRCADSIEDLGGSRRFISMIFLDARSGYHQIRVREYNQDNLAFFTRSGTKKSYRIMPFSLKNSPEFYTAMM